MPSPQTAYDLITSSMRLINALAAGEVPTADEAQVGLNCLNDLLETWSTETLSIWNTPVVTFPLVGGQGTYLIGPGGDFDLPQAPARIHDCYCTVAGSDFPIAIIGQGEYDSITVKNSSGDIANWMLYLNTFPLASISLWPVPTSNNVTLSLNYDVILSSVPSTSTVLSYPVGYSLALRYNLAVMLAAEYGAVLPPTVLQIATASHANIKRANKNRSVCAFGSEYSTEPGVAIWVRGY